MLARDQKGGKLNKLLGHSHSYHNDEENAGVPRYLSAGGGKESGFPRGSNTRLLSCRRAQHPNQSEPFCKVQGELSVSEVRSEEKGRAGVSIEERRGTGECLSCSVGFGDLPRTLSV